MARGQARTLLAGLQPMTATHWLGPQARLTLPARQALRIAVWLLLLAGTARGQEPELLGQLTQQVELPAQASASAAASGFVVQGALHSKLLALNTLGLSGVVQVAVHATRGWGECQQAGTRCRVVLFLPGFDGSPEFTYLGKAFGLRQAVDTAVQAGKLPPLVVISVDPRAPIGGSFYTDSTTTGQWTRFIVEELVPTVEAALKIQPLAARRLVLGHSMGGFGALHLALEHPEAWSGVAGLSPVASTAFAAGSRSAAAAKASDADPTGTAGRLTRLLAAPTEKHFYERLFWAMAAAWTSDGLDWRKALAPGDKPTISPAHAANWLRLDPVHRLAEPKSTAVCKLRLILTVGTKDPIIAAADVRAVATAGNRLCAAAKPFRLTVHEGNHGNHLRADVLAALAALTSVVR